MDDRPGRGKRSKGDELIMQVTVNGKKHILEEGYTLRMFLNDLGLKNMVIVFFNGRKLKISEYDILTLTEGDTLKVIKPVGGG